MKKQTIIALLICTFIASVFSITASGQNTYYIKSACGKYLTLQNLSGNAGTPVVLSDFDGSLAQQWKTVPKPNAQGGTSLFIQSVKVPSRVLGKNEEGTQVQLCYFTGGQGQEWVIKYRPEWNGVYTLRSLVGWENLHKGDGPCDNNSPLMTSSDDESPAQMWYLEDVKLAQSLRAELNNILYREVLKKSLGN